MEEEDELVSENKQEEIRAEAYVGIEDGVTDNDAVNGERQHGANAATLRDVAEGKCLELRSNSEERHVTKLSGTDAVAI